MPAFTTESLVRTKFQLASTTDFPAALFADAIAEAHEAITARLDPSVDTGSPPAALITGETLLAGARAFRNLAAREAATQRAVTIGGQRDDTTVRHGHLLATATRTEEEAWLTLAPFLAAPPARENLTTTDTTPILGGVY